MVSITVYMKSAVIRCLVRVIHATICFVSLRKGAPHRHCKVVQHSGLFRLLRHSVHSGGEGQCAIHVKCRYVWTCVCVHVRKCVHFMGVGAVVASSSEITFTGSRFLFE